MKTTMKEVAEMKKGSGLVLAVLFLVGLMVAVSGNALAIVGGTGNTGGGGSCVDPYINPSASGAKITGTVNVIYSPTGTAGLWNLAITMRVVKGTQLYYFWRVTDPVSMADCESTVSAITQFVNEDVASTVYPTLYNNKKPGPIAVLKGGTMDVGTVIGNGYTPQLDPPFPWFMLDFEYAVQ